MKGISSFIVQSLHFLVCGVLAGLCWLACGISSHWLRAVIDGAYEVQAVVHWTKTVAVICKGLSTMEYATTWMANGKTVCDNGLYLVSVIVVIVVCTHAKITVVWELLETFGYHASIALLHGQRETILLFNLRGDT